VRNKRCPSCGGAYEQGALRARPATVLTEAREASRVVSDFFFVRPGVPTSGNPVEAFRQGLREEPGEQLIPVVALRCAECGRVELFATDA
jgi:hypothetical protein